ncbi:MAG: prepilin-type N-terminal cleavage/methylation domain-containing protein [Syntrophorhabdaceae bacterium]|nr:prepilin-type N-terminal cleavage/methylation domain-containing protein [Syntrophorhabdaceae bacterium]
MNDKGFTLVELIMFIIIGAIFLPASMIAFTSVMNNYSRPDYYVKARFYADKRMAEITSKPYDDIYNEFPIGGVSTLCPNITASAAPEAPDDGYTTSCAIVAITPNLTISPIQTDNKAPYKKITVTVTYSGPLSDYTISTIVTRRPNLSP